MLPKTYGLWWADLRWRVGALVFVAVCLVGSGCAAWTLHRLAITSADISRADAQSTAQSVAHTLAQQLARAVRLGIPLAEIPQVDAYLGQTLQHHPALVAIAVQAAEGKTLHSAGPAINIRLLPSAAQVPVEVGGRLQAVVQVYAESSYSVQQSLTQARWWAVLAMLGGAVVAAGLAVWLCGRKLECQRREVLLHLKGGMELPAEVHPAGLQFLVEALKASQEQHGAAQQSLQDYAQALLNMDFDGSMRADIERIVRNARA